MYANKMVKYNNDGKEETHDIYIHSGNKRISDIRQFDSVYDEAMDDINQKLTDDMGESSGWVMDIISSIDVNIGRM